MPPPPPPQVKSHHRQHHQRCSVTAQYDRVHKYRSLRPYITNILQLLWSRHNKFKLAQLTFPAAVRQQVAPQSILWPYTYVGLSSIIYLLALALARVDPCDPHINMSPFSRHLIYLITALNSSSISISISIMSLTLFDYNLECDRLLITSSKRQIGFITNDSLTFSGLNFIYSFIFNLIVTNYFLQKMILSKWLQHGVFINLLTIC